jgi:protoporphyrinogen oxidase
MLEKEAIIIGSGPAGCAAGCALIDSGTSTLIIDRLDSPGGLARSVVKDRNTFDIGPHRFFTKSPEVLELWRRFLGPDLTSVDRLTRILYRGKLFNYPLTPLNALFGLGIVSASTAFVDYGLTRIRRIVSPREPESFEDWVTDNFGRTLYETFFKHYTEKVWGIPCSQISADWASQRIKGLNLFTALYNALLKSKKADVKTLVDQFLYPRQGAGRLYSNMIGYFESCGGDYIPNAEVVGIASRDNGWEVRYESAGQLKTINCRHVLSSAPLNDFLGMLTPSPPEEIRAAASKLRFRNHYCVNLIVRNKANLFADNWIYVHSPELKTGRIANYANFSKDLQATSDSFPITVEFFSFTGDTISEMDDKKKIDLAIKELKNTGLMNTQHIEDAFTVFSPSAYPVIEIGYENLLAKIRAYLGTLKNIQTFGRGGLFQYNNQDHSIMTGLLAARNILGEKYDLWSVNIDAEYHESGVTPDVCSPTTDGKGY